VALPAFAAGRRAAARLFGSCSASRAAPLSVDISCQHGAQQQTHRSGVRRKK